MSRTGWRTIALGCLLLSGRATAAERVSVAAAANLVHALEALHAEFKRAAPDVRLTSATGASGSLFAQIQNGAPFDVFLSADTDYPLRLVQAGHGERASLQTFATGRLVLWTSRADLEAWGGMGLPTREGRPTGQETRATPAAIDDLAAVLRDARVKKIAIAQPRTAPYGRAAEAVLERIGVLQEARGKLVVGESISQTAQFVETGNADAGFVALSLVRSPRLAGKGRWIEVPAELYANVPLDHAAVLTKRGAANPAARRYLEFLRSEAAKKILRDFGYGVPR